VEYILRYTERRNSNVQKVASCSKYFRGGYAVTFGGCSELRRTDTRTDTNTSTSRIADSTFEGSPSYDDEN